MNRPKLFHDQFRECHDEGMQGEGPFMKWKDHPEMLPTPWSRAAKLIAEELKVNPDAGLRTISCLKFGGICNGANEECRKMRGL